jgi:hypothetical protein
MSKRSIAAICTALVVVGAMLWYAVERFTTDSAVTHQVHGAQAGGLRNYSDWDVANGMPKGLRLALGIAKVYNSSKYPAVVESAVPISDSPYLKVTRCKIWSSSFRAPKNARRLKGVPLLDADDGWPPKGYPIVRMLPEKNVVIPGHSGAEFPFGTWTEAPEGVRATINGVRVIFTQNNQRYDWILQIHVSIRRCDNAKPSCKPRRVGAHSGRPAK